MLCITRVRGVDFSGAAKAGRTAWVSDAIASADGRLEVVDICRLEQFAGTADREPALRALVELIRESRDTLWAIDFPFGLPLELGFGDWPRQLELVQAWDAGAYAFGVHCLNTARARAGTGHLRRQTDVDQRAPFDCYHYRIIYQTFHGMRDVLGPLASSTGVAILPFQLNKLARAARVVVEACPSSTLKRLGLPHQNYKQPAGGPLTPIRRRTRRRILDGLAVEVVLPDLLRRRAMRDGGGDAIDAVLAAAGGWHAWRARDPVADGRHERFSREGLIYA